VANNGGWHIPCVCGATVISPTRETTCDKCGRILSVDGWGGIPAAAPAADRNLATA